MKRFYALVLALVMLATLTACGAKKPSSGDADVPEAEKQEVEYVFSVEADVHQDEVTAEDGTMLMQVYYELPYLELHAVKVTDGEEVALDENEADEKLLAVRDHFNAVMQEEWYDAELSYVEEISGWAKEHYEDYIDNQYSWFSPYFDELRLGRVDQTSGGLLSVATSYSTFTGGAHPFGGPIIYNYDLNTGEFLQYSDFAEDAEAFRNAAAGYILEDIYANGEEADYFDTLEPCVNELDGADVHFNADGMNVIFPEYAIAPYAMGTPTFTVPYAYLLGSMSDYGRELLADYITPQAQVLADYFEARELWNYFDLCTMPTDAEQSAELNGYTYHRVDCRGLSSMAELHALLLTRFDEAIVDELLAQDRSITPLYCDIDGALYCIDGARGSDITRGRATYEVKFDDEGKDMAALSGKVIATVEEYTEDDPILNEITGRYEYTVGGYATVEFPFVQTEHGAQFTHFESIW